MPNENVDKQSQLQNTHAKVNIFARQKSKAPSKVWIVQKNLHIVQNNLVEINNKTLQKQR